MIRVEIQNKVKRTGYQTYHGFTDYKLKKQFLNDMSKIYDSIKDNEDLTCRLFFMNLGDKK